ncbi:hypothetical protein AK812_SmicGene31346 [Symbiodinium microadriaticum]|uniref:Uncharacterized protein n=1 Tax=Symbiodinium microadriaticum TaxID=2951 RepID=A0A1Q9CWX8_SYMMI|nr:hypothetical protein AK812_SmicGene31346 [Symbiodinium microadriaticum]
MTGRGGHPGFCEASRKSLHGDSITSPCHLDRVVLIQSAKLTKFGGRCRTFDSFEEAQPSLPVLSDDPQLSADSLCPKRLLMGTPGPIRGTFLEAQQAPHGAVHCLLQVPELLSLSSMQAEMLVVELADIGPGFNWAEPCSRGHEPDLDVAAKTYAGISRHSTLLWLAAVFSQAVVSGQCSLEQVRSMPFETVNEQYVRERKVLVCERCRRPMDTSVQHRDAYQTGGSIAGSLGGSVGGSMLAGAVLGPVGALAGAIGGAIAGSRAGAAASEGICDAVDSSGTQLCNVCKEAANVRQMGHQNWGGGRLGSGDEPTAPLQASSASAPSAPGVGERLGEVASGAGAKIGEAASAVGEGLSGVGSWMRKSVSSMTGSDEPKPTASGRPDEAFRSFEGSGRALGTDAADVDQRRNARAAAAEAAMRRAGQAPTNGYAQTSAPGRGAANAASTQALIDEDEALARRLQEQFDLEEREGR